MATIVQDREIPGRSGWQPCSSASRSGRYGLNHSTNHQPTDIPVKSLLRNS